MAFNFDPNMNLSGRMSKKHVSLTFGVWEYRRTISVFVGGNTSGLGVIEQAVDVAFDSLGPEFDMINEAGDLLTVLDEDEQDTEWLSDMMISAELLSMVPDGEL